MRRDPLAHYPSALTPPSLDADAASLLARLRSGLEGKYTIEREVGRGGMSIVYLARDIAHDRNVALKILRPELAATVPAARFLREIEIESRLQHPNILPMYDSGAAEGMPYYVMPYVEGESLRDRLHREGQLPMTDAMSIARDVAAALDYAHAHGVVHRDVKPGNILLAGSRAIVADFGIARAMTIVAGEELTDSGLALGTPEYMSPEQGTGERRLDGRSDVYSLGCVVHEMIAGEPPFTGPTMQAVIARHCQERPPSLHVIRPTVPASVERAIETALAKVPADRFPTAGAFVEALERPDSPWEIRVRALRRHRTLALGLGALVLAAGVVAVRGLRPPVAALDPNRVVVFPLRDASASGALTAAGEEVATYIGYALDGTRPLTWLEGWDLSASSDASPRPATASAALRLSRQARAGHYIDGSILRGADSVTVVLRLHNAAGDSIVRRAGASSPVALASLPQLGLSAVAELLPALLAPGRRVDLSALSDRKPSAVAHFLQGERDHRQMLFPTAIEHYRAALREDSMFALAALRGAQAANWMGHFGDDKELADAALRRVDLLPPRHALFARGLAAYLHGSADSAVHYLTRLIAGDSTSHAAWTLLGEVYARLLPSSAAPDSAARAALEHARRVEPDFAPALLLLEEIALRDGNVDLALTLRRELREAGADTTHALQRDVMLRCVRDGVGDIDWPAAVRQSTMSVLAAGKHLSVHASQPTCARTAFEAVVGHGDAPSNLRWGALLGLQSLLVALGKEHDVRSVLTSSHVTGLPARSLYVLNAAAAGVFDAEAAEEVAAKGVQYETMPPQLLWLVGIWESRHRDTLALQGIARALRAKADSSGARRDALLADAIDARLALASGDTASALRRLTALRPTAPRGQLTWQPWESLAGERLLLAELLLARGQASAAERVAGQIDASEPVVHLLYLRPSLRIRLDAARARGDERRAAHYQERLRKLGTR